MWRHFQVRLKIEEFGNSTEIQEMRVRFQHDPDSLADHLHLLASEYLDEDR